MRGRKDCDGWKIYYLTFSTLQHNMPEAPRRLRMNGKGKIGGRRPPYIALDPCRGAWVSECLVESYYSVVVRRVCYSPVLRLPYHSNLSPRQTRLSHDGSWATRRQEIDWREQWAISHDLPHYPLNRYSHCVKGPAAPRRPAPSLPGLSAC